jgi:hypothetical protein
MHPVLYQRPENTAGSVHYRRQSRARERRRQLFDAGAASRCPARTRRRRKTARRSRRGDETNGAIPGAATGPGGHDADRHQLGARPIFVRVVVRERHTEGVMQHPHLSQILLSVHISGVSKHLRPRREAPNRNTLDRASRVEGPRGYNQPVRPSWWYTALPSASNTTARTSIALSDVSRHRNPDGGVPATNLKPRDSRSVNTRWLSDRRTTRSTSLCVRSRCPTRASTPQSPSTQASMPTASNACNTSITSRARTHTDCLIGARASHRRPRSGQCPPTRRRTAANGQNDQRVAPPGSFVATA